jgi:hypothetical protein
VGHLLTENRHGLIVSAVLSQADGYAERVAAIEMIEGVAGEHRITLGADKGFDTEEFVEECRRRNVTPHVRRLDSGDVARRLQTHFCRAGSASWGRFSAPC